MGCGASLDRTPSATALDPGARGDRASSEAKQQQNGVAKAEGRTRPLDSQLGGRGGSGSLGGGATSAATSIPEASTHASSTSVGTLTAESKPPSSRPPSAKPSTPKAAAASSSPSLRPPSAKPSTPKAAAASNSPSSRPPSAKPSTPEAAVASNSPSSRPPSAKPSTPKAAAASNSPSSRPPSAKPGTPINPSVSPPKPLAEAPAAAPTAPNPALPQPRMIDCAVSLQFLMDFCETVPQDMPTWRVVTDVVVPATRSRACRYVELLQPGQVGRCDYFISHRWATPFSHLVRYVKKHLVELGDVKEGGRDGDKGGSPAQLPTIGDGGDEIVRSADQVFVWCDIFAINQHPGQVQADDLSQLKDCVEASQQTLLCLDDKGLVLTRIWCLYEIWNTVLAGGPPKLAVLGYDVNQEAFKEVYITLDVAEAQATVDSDRVRILADIAATTGLQELNLVIKSALIESTQAEAENAQRVLLPQARDWRDYQRVMEAINKHSQMLNAVGRYKEAARYGYLTQSVSTAWEKSQEQASAAPTGGLPAARPNHAPATSYGGAATPFTAAAGVGAEEGGGEGVPPPWHWSLYPKDAELRQLVGRAEAAERGGRMEAAIGLYREAVARAEEKQAAVAGADEGPGTDEGGGGVGDGGMSDDGAAALDAAGCVLRLAVFLAAQGFVEQATSTGEPAVAAFAANHATAKLAFASAAVQFTTAVKQDTDSKDLRSRLVESAYHTQESLLGPNHPDTLVTLREKAELTYTSGDFISGAQLFHTLAVRLSGGLDLLAPSTASPAAVAASVQLAGKQTEVWFLLASYLGSQQGREDDVVQLCRFLIPHKRREHVARLRAAVESGGEHVETATNDLRRLGLAPTPLPPGEEGQNGAGAGGDPAGLLDPDDASWDIVTNMGDLVTWSTALGKKGDLEAAVRLQWRLAELVRNTPSMAESSMELPGGKVSMVEAYERCLLLDMSVPGVARTSARMKQDEGGADSTSGNSGNIDGGVTTGQQGSDKGSGGGWGDGASKYSGPGYLELVTRMSDLWVKQEWSEAEAVCRSLVACQAAGHGPVSRQVVDARGQLASLLKSAGRVSEALAEMRAALGVHEQLLGGKDPGMAQTLQMFAHMLADEDPVEAEAMYRRAVALVEKVHGPDHSDVGTATVSLASFVMSQPDRLEEGQQLLQRGLEIQAKFQAQQAARTHAF